MYQVQIFYKNLDETDVIFENEEYNKALDKFQTILCYFKIPHSITYAPTEKTSYTFLYENMEISIVNSTPK